MSLAMRLLGTITACFLALIAVSPIHAQPQSNARLPAQAQRWGNLMTDHWLTVDLSRQLDRAVFYHPSNQSFEVERLRQSMSTTEKNPLQALQLYRGLYRNPSGSDASALERLLDEISSAESENGHVAEALLQAVGRQLNRGAFTAIPVDRKQLEPAWDARAFIGKNYRPTRILFGSTATAGDDRLLPLRFDFGHGLFSFHAPMDSQGALNVSSNVQNETASAYVWMKQHRIGWHYWAGIYNNQNTYVPSWFVQQHRDDDDVWMKLAGGKVLRPDGGEWAQVNVWNPSVQEYINDYCQAQARLLRNDPFFVCYDYTAEPHPWGSQPPDPPGQPQYSGYNQSAVEAFRDWLHRKFADIGALNSSWQTHYSSFEAIDAPPDPYVSVPARASGLSYEFERFRCEGHTRFWRLAYDGYRQFDRGKPVVANAGMYMSGWPVEGLDTWQLQKAGVADWIDMHMNNFWPNLPEQIYLYSLCRLTGKVPVQFEYIWTFPRPEPFDDSNESDFRAVCQASIWRNLVWGKKVFVFFDAAYNWPAYHNAFLDGDLGYSILRPSICVLPVMKRKALRFNDLLVTTEVSSPSSIVLQPSASIWNSPPLHPNKSFSYHTVIAGQKVHPLLFSKNYPFLYVPEEAVLDDGYPLKAHRVIILPEAPYLPAALTDRLLEWVRRGGTLISLGPPGIWDQYGQQDGRLMRTVFGPCEIEDQQPGHWQWSLKLLDASMRVETVHDEQGRMLAARARYGKGTFLVSTSGYEDSQRKRVFYQTLDRTLGPRPATCVSDSFELVLREDSQRRQYLFVLNPHARDIRQDQIVLRGKYRECVDLGVGSGVPIALRTANNETRFSARLYPGEGTVIALRQ